MKKILFIILIGVLIMLKPINAIIKDSLGNIIHRGSVVTGVITVDRGDGSYDVLISEAEEAYPHIFTLSDTPDLAVGDKVRILCEDGCKERLIILPPITAAVTTIRRYALIIASPNELKVFDMDSVALYTLTTGGWAYSGCDITMDSNGNSYTETNWDTLKKYDSDGNLLVTLGIENPSNWFVSMNIGPDGYLYTLEGRNEFFTVAKRNTTDLTIVEDIVISDDIWDRYTGGICFDSSGNFYVYKDDDEIVEKYSSTGTLLAQLDTGNLSNEYAGFGVCGSNVYFVRSTNKVYYAPLSLASYAEWDLPSGEAYALTVADGQLVLSGWDGDGDGATTIYDSDRNLVSQVKLGAGYAYKAGGYNF